ncbi:MAG: PH domain-containing protein [Anaerolineae bacterium]|jgi:hypothetical protein|nr:PH domain-containing protein [Anaerolineae bacterium]
MTTPVQPNRSHTFHPERRRGFLFYGIAFSLSVAAVVVGILFLLDADGLAFVGYLVLALAGGFGIPFLGKALVDLFRAKYTINRDSLRLQWGGRIERIPIQQIEWVRTFDSLGLEMHVPRFYRFGIVRGLVNQRELGPVEFLSDTVAQSIFIATETRVFVVSPTDMHGFLTQIQNAMEAGSLGEAAPLSVVDETVLKGIWEQPAGRLLLTALLACNLALLIVVQLIVSAEGGILAFQQQEVISLTSLRLLPYLSIAFGILDLVFGIFFYHARKQLEVAYVLWISGALMPVLFAASILIAL